MGVTGSGKTFTMANVVQELQRPALVLSHNKTLAAQLYAEFRDPNYAAVPSLRRMVSAGHLGRKSGKGFYDYSK